MKPVWIIDDDRSIRWVLEKALTRESISFKSFASADEALAELVIAAPQVIVSDIRMPGESGLKLLQQARRRSDQAVNRESLVYQEQLLARARQGRVGSAHE